MVDLGSLGDGVGKLQDIDLAVSQASSSQTQPPLNGILEA